MEYKLWALLLLIADRRGLRTPRPGTRGWILDAGAHDGATSVMLCKAMAYLQLHVLALEPLAQNAKIAQHGQQRARRELNLKVQRAGLGKVNGTTGHYPIEYDARGKAACACRSQGGATTTTRARRPTPS